MLLARPTDAGGTVSREMPNGFGIYAWALLRLGAHHRGWALRSARVSSG